ncbi:unnamed protein product [Phytophthora fragariaefolia]|uniref:Unnamed protein product n=1 Tax=Phytophthora fragariaefolia TaxID=1490495 RepID=A0A9W6U9V8_9STRA|nr:unnamed protein product [Phytophthora fragariaefolia]
MATTADQTHHDEPLPLLAADHGVPRDSIHGALLEDKTPEILFHEDAIGDTDSEHEDDDAVSTDGSLVLDDDAKLVLCRSTGRVGAARRWGTEPLAADLPLLRVVVELAGGLLAKVQGQYLGEKKEHEDTEKEDADTEKEERAERLVFELERHELITKVHLFRVRREIHAIQFVTDRRTSERFGGTKRGELCKAVEAPEDAFVAGFFGDAAKDEAGVDLGFRFAERPKTEDADVAEVDQVN